MATQNDDTTPAPPSVVDDLLADSPGSDAPFIESVGPNDSLTDYLNSGRRPQPMSTPESIKRGEAAMAEGRLRAAETMARRIENKELLPAAEFQAALDMSAAALEAAVESGRLFVLVTTDGAKYYPAFYADRTLNRTTLEAVASEMKGLPPESQYWFLTSRRTNLQATPLDALRAGRLEDVLGSARGFVIT